MKKIYKNFAKTLAVLMLLPAVFAFEAAAKDTYTGTILSYGSGFNTRAVTRQFTLTIDSRTTDEQVTGYLNTLKNQGQNKLLDAIDDQTVGRFSVDANVGIPVNVVRERVIDGKRRIFVVFQRWTQFAELRYGYRSLDYPFGVIELYIDERTGKGEGTYIAAAKIRWESGEGEKADQIEIENFATFPARLLAVKRTTRDLP